jgi:hypothetical protein
MAAICGRKARAIYRAGSAGRTIDSPGAGKGQTDLGGVFSASLPIAQKATHLRAGLPPEDIIGTQADAAIREIAAIFRYRWRC